MAITQAEENKIKDLEGDRRGRTPQLDSCHMSCIIGNSNREKEVFS